MNPVGIPQRSLMFFLILAWGLAIFFPDDAASRVPNPCGWRFFSSAFKRYPKLENFGMEIVEQKRIRPILNQIWREYQKSGAQPPRIYPFFLESIKETTSQRASFNSHWWKRLLQGSDSLTDISAQIASSRKVNYDGSPVFEVTISEKKMYLRPISKDQGVYFPLLGTVPPKTLINPRSKADVQGFAFLIGDNDLHFANYAVTKEGDCTLFDFSRTFYPGVPPLERAFTTGGTFLPERYSKPFIDGLIQLDERKLRDEFRGLLTETELEGLLLRREVLLRDARKRNRFLAN